MNVLFFRPFFLRPSPDRALRVSLQTAGHTRPRARPRSRPSSSRSGDDDAYQFSSDRAYKFRIFVPFRRLYALFEGLTLSRFVAALKTFTYTNYNNVRLFYNFVCLVYAYRVFSRVSVLFSLRFNLNFTRIFASFYLQILFLIRPF